MQFHATRRAGWIGFLIALMVGFASSAVMAEEPSALTTGRAFRILLLNDLHLFENNDGTVPMKQLAEMAGRLSPNLVVLNGDVWMDEMGDKGVDRCRFLCGEMAKLNVPWAFVWGNHDLADPPVTAHELLQNAPLSLYRGAQSHGQYRIEIRGDDGRPVWHLLCLNSGQSHKPRRPDERLGLGEEELAWFVKESQAIRAMPPAARNSFVFVHVPLAEFGMLAESGRATGLMCETVHYANQPFEAFRAFQKSGMVRAIFCGHDHTNDFQGTYQGIFLKTGRSLGGYGGLAKGGTVIDVDTREGSFKTFTVLSDGAAWTPPVPMQKGGKLAASAPARAASQPAETK